jgi:hypothetical protein
METKTAPDQIVPDRVIPAKQSNKKFPEGRCLEVADFRNESIARAGGIDLAGFGSIQIAWTPTNAR